ncbi:cell division protein FtsQ/DivIB [Alienimonas californiensis]|uniref:Cell division protein FtsQ n=1 Tax=Alienimonas californiensis TaxID=2527989 RepID=A0A517P3R2_9PLAN|nr:hypothetical protein [Alienimonas californiensis]QDT14011.1 Cell division protein FtsQ [Alienimonas californiensis]
MPKVARPADRPSNADPAPVPDRPAARERSPFGPSRLRRVAGWFFTPQRLLMLGLIPLCAAAVPWAIRQLPDLSAREEYRLTADRVRLEPPPPLAVPPNVVAQVLGEEPASILEDGLAERLADGFAKHPWVAGVERVEVLSPAAAVVRLRYRSPAAAVAAGDGLYPIDATGVLLPPADFTRPAADALPRIGGIESTPGPAGTLWPDPAVAGAAAICAALAQDWERLDLAGVRPLDASGARFWERVRGTPDASEDEASEPAGDPRFELVTRAGSRILWGRPPGTTHPGELATDTKRLRLTRDLAGVLAGERSRGPEWADLTAWDGVYHLPLRTAMHPHSPRR